MHRRRAGRKLCRLTRDPAERPLAYDLRRLPAAGRRPRQSAGPRAPSDGRAARHCSTAAGPRPRRTVDSAAPSARPRLRQSAETVAPSAFPPSAGSTDCDDTRPSSAPPVPSAGRAARPAERRNAGTPPVRATPPRQRRPLSGNLRRLLTCTFLLFRSGLFCTHRYRHLLFYVLSSVLQIRPGIATLVCWGPVRSCCDPRIQLCRHSRFVVSPVALRSGFVYWPATHSLKAPAPLLFCTEPSIFIGAAHKVPPILYFLFKGLCKGIDESKFTNNYGSSSCFDLLRYFGLACTMLRFGIISIYIYGHRLFFCPLILQQQKCSTAITIT